MSEFLNPDDIHEFGQNVDFGKTAADYAKFRKGFPERFLTVWAIMALEPQLSAYSISVLAPVPLRADWRCVEPT